MKVLFDSNILMDNFNGHAEAVLEMLRYEDAIISSINWMEAACVMTPAEKIRFQAFLDDTGIKVVHPDNDIMHRATIIRGNSLINRPKFPLPDCIIRATAEASCRVIITRNPRDFGGEGPRVRVPYELVGGVVVNIKPPLS